MTNLLRLLATVLLFYILICAALVLDIFFFPLGLIFVGLFTAFVSVYILTDKPKRKWYHKIFFIN